MKNNILTHVKGTGWCLLSYFMGVILSWAAYPLIMIALHNIIAPDLSQSIYTLVNFLIYLIIAYLLLHGFGERDRKPYNWVRYPLKGLVCALFAWLLINAVGFLVIFLANKYVIVHHPKFVIETLNGYLRIVVYMPFYWLLRLIEGAPHELCPIPSATYLRGLLVTLLTLPAPAFGYWMGFTGRRIFKRELKSPFLRRLVYSEPKKKR